MNTNRLMDAIGEIGEKYVSEAGAIEKKRRHPALRRILGAAAAAAVLCVLVGIPVLAAADIGASYELLYEIYPAAAQRLKPVRTFCEDNGIRMEVTAADVEGSHAELLVTMRDLTGDRVDGTIDLFDSYSIRQAFDSCAGCERLGFDEEKKGATFLISIDRTDGKDIRSEKITFEVRRFLSGKQNFDTELTQLSVSRESPALLKNADLRGWGGAESAEQTELLQPDPKQRFAPTEGVQITAAGFVDGKLHVQAHYDDILKTDNHGYVYLLDADGGKTESKYSVSFWDADHSGSYEEYVFNVRPEEISVYRIFGCFTTCSMLHEGKWQVTFLLD